MAKIILAMSGRTIIAVNAKVLTANSKRELRGGDTVEVLRDYDTREFNTGLDTTGRSGGV